MSENLKIATLRGPSAVGMVKMMDNARKCGGPDISVFDEPAQILDRMSRSTPDFAVLPAASGSIIRSRGLNYTPAATMIQGGLYLCGTFSINDIAGATIHVLGRSADAGPHQPTPPEAMLRSLLLKKGIDPDRDVNFESSCTSHRALADAASESTDGIYLLAEPFLSIALAANPRLHILIDIADEWRKIEGTLPDIALIFVRTNPQMAATASLLRELSASCEWVKANPAAAGQLSAELGIFSDAAAIEASIPRSGFNISPIAQRKEPAQPHNAAAPGHITEQKTKI